jgi:hypothetical protein
MRKFIEKQTEKHEENLKNVNAQSRNIITQALSFIDGLIQDSTAEDVDQRVHFTKGLFSLRGYLNQYLKQQEAAIINHNTVGALISSFEKEEEIKQQLESGENPQKRKTGEHPVSLKDVRTVKAEMEEQASQEFHGQEEIPEAIVEEE